MRPSSRRHLAVLLAVGFALCLAYSFLRGTSDDLDLQPAFKETGPGTFFDRFSQHSIYTAVEDAYFQRLQGVHVRCAHLATFSRGWRVCASNAFALHGPCLVYSFGVQHQWAMEEFLAESSGCKVRAFDPAMSKEDHVHLPGPVDFFKIGLGGRDQRRLGGWRMNTFHSLLRKFNDTARPVDLVKLDIAYFEWEALEAMLATGSLSRVKQLVAVLHTADVTGRAATREEYLRYHRILDGVERLGFRRCFRHEDFGGVERLAASRLQAKDAMLQRSGRLGRSCCHAVSYINMNFAKGSAGLAVL